MENLYVIAGLGNPGRQYELTRHNVGFLTLDLLSEKFGIPVTKVKHKALIGDGTIEGVRVLLVKPQTFMNLSGECIREIVEWYKLPLDRLIIVYDDIDLEPGKIRMRPKGSAGTHNGMRSILYQIQSENFPRVRIGIGKAPQGWDLADFVLSRFNEEETKLMRESITQAVDEVVKIIKSGAKQ